MLVAVKTSINDDKKAVSNISYEQYHHKTLIDNGAKYVPKIIGTGYFQDRPFIATEYA
jgi:hypothetical protein